MLLAYLEVLSLLSHSMDNGMLLSDQKMREYEQCVWGAGVQGYVTPWSKAI